MLAVEFDAGRVQINRQRADPIVENGEVLVRVIRAGICETDLQLLRGYMDFHGVPGHEFVGIAESGRFAGKRVVGEINCPCGKCELCRDGLGNHCPNRTVLGILNRQGAFAEFVSLPEVNLHAVPDEVTTDEAVFTEPLAAAFQIPVQVPLKSRDRVTVLGDGRLGNLCAQVLAMHGCRVRVVGKHPEKLAVIESLGIEALLLSKAGREKASDIVVDCTGSPEGLRTALDFVRPRGTVVFKTTVAGSHELPLAPVVIDEITLVGSRCGPFAPALEALRTKRVKVAPLITERYPLQEAAAAFDQARESRSALKILLDVGKD
ncbi:MAG: alcohol dehydrogenase catalytic domain-containing protein [Planctomycetaceae bacterium]